MGAGLRSPFRLDFLDTPDGLTRLRFPDIANSELNFCGSGVTASASAATAGLGYAHIGGVRVAAPAAAVSPLAAIGIARGHAGLVGVEGFNRALQGRELHVEDVARKDAAYAAQRKRGPLTCLRHLHLKHSSSAQPG